MDDGGPMLQGADDRERRDPKDEKDDHCAHPVSLREVLPKLQNCKFNVNCFFHINKAKCSDYSYKMDLFFKTSFFHF